MDDIQFPIDFTFKISTIANDFIASDVNGKTVAYVRQKMFKLKEDIRVYDNESKTRTNFTIKADRWIDFSAAYSMTDTMGKPVGKIARKGWASIWKAEYDIINQFEKTQYKITEDSAWIKVLDSLLGQIPVLSIFTGYLFNPSYTIKDFQGNEIARLKKEPSFFGRKFKLTKLGAIDTDDQARIILSFMMMVLLERRRG